MFQKDIQYYKFCLYGFFKNLRFFDPFLLLFFIDKGLSFFQIGTLIMIREITVNVFEIPSGILADAFGRRRVMIISFVAYLISFIVFFLSESYWPFALGFVFYGFGDAFRTGTHKAMIMEYLKYNGWEKLKVRYYGHTRSWSQAGSAVSAVVAATIVISGMKYEYVFLFSTIPYILDLIMISTYVKVVDGVFLFKKGTSVKHHFFETGRNFLRALKNPFMLKTVLNVSVFAGYHKAIKDYIQPMIQMLAITYPIYFFRTENTQGAFFIGLIYFILYMLTAYAARKSHLIVKLSGNNVFSSLNLSLFIGFFTGVVCGIFWMYELMYVSIILFMIMYVIENIRKPIGISAISDTFEHQVLATALSAESQAETIFAAITAPIIGFVADLFGIGQAIILVSALFLFLTLFLRVPKLYPSSKL